MEGEGGAPAMRYLLRLLPGLLFAASTWAADADDLAFNRDAFGASGWPLWSALTPFEEQTVSRFAQAEAGDPDALLALYLVASGDVRSQQEYETIRDRLYGQLPSSAGNRDGRQKGEALLKMMFERFLETGDGSDTLSGYDAGQSQLSAIFQSGRYNCISSSLLYIVMARQVGLEANGVILPSHAFVDITLPDGEIVSVETTSPRGFGVEHNRAWFERTDEAWFRERDLDMPRYEDYEARQRVSAATLGLENMWNQHAASLPYPDRMRLAELQAHLQPDNLQAQMNRMIYYSREAAWLDEQGETATQRRFMRQTAAWREHVANLLERSSIPPDEAFMGLWYWLEIQRAAVLIEDHTPHEGAMRVMDVLEALSPSVNDARTIRHNAHVALDEYVQRIVDHSLLDDAGPVIDRLPAVCGMAALCQQALARLYSGLAAIDWEEGEWSAVIEHFRAYLDIAGSSEFVPAIQQNMEGAWLNWAEQNWYDEYRDQAMERLQRCMTELEQAERCRERLEAYRAAY